MKNALVLVLALVACGCSTMIKVTSTPAGAEVTCDGLDVGKTPCEFKASSDSQIWVRAPGYLPYRVFVGARPSGGAYWTPTTTENCYNLLLNPDPDARPVSQASKSDGAAPASSTPPKETAPAAPSAVAPTSAPASPAKSKFCTRCGAAVPSDAAFCGECGAKR